MPAYDEHDASQGECFLCAPSADLLIFEDTEFFYLAGLGPLVDGYSLLATRSHFKSMADLPDALAGKRDTLMDRVRRQLSEKFGCCLVTEHGRMVVCEEGDFDSHCYHGHFLLFPGIQDISGTASSYFGKRQSFSDLAAAMVYAATCEEYVLISPDPGRFNIFSMPLNLPRQFTRILVASSIDKLADAHWADHPERGRAQTIAGDLRTMFGK